MLRDESIGVAPTWAPETKTDSYREIDRQLRSIAQRRAGLDVEEARWIREAEKQRIWRKLGFSTALEYLEEVFGYSPRTATDRMRVARELGALPALEAEVRDGRLPYSAAKELSRVMTPATEATWLARARGKNLRDIEALVAGRTKGDSPDAPQDPALLKRRLVVELPARVDALLQQCRGVAEDEMGDHIEDAALIELLCRRFLEPPVASTKPTRPAHRIVIDKCDECRRGWQAGRGQRVLLDDNDLARAECDAEVIDLARAECDAEVIDGRKAAKPEPTRAAKPTPTIPHAVRKLVWRRDEGRCRVPGCRATRHLDIHHIVPRAHGGDHDPSNLLVLCSGHHKLHHAGLLSITGLAPDQLTFVRDGRRLGIDHAKRRTIDDASTDPKRRSIDDASTDPKRRSIDNASTESKRRHINDTNTESKRRHIDDANTESMRRHIDDDKMESKRPSLDEARPRSKRSRFDEVVLAEQAKQALVELGYTRGAARQAVLNAVAAAPDADVATLVRTVLARTSTDEPIGSGDPCKLAKQALVNLGYSAAIATRAVAVAAAHVGSDDLSSLIREALQCCG